MKRVLRWLLLLLLLASGALLWTFLPANLPRPEPIADALPPASPPHGMTIAVLDTGSIESRAVLAYRGGSFGDKRTFGMAPILVRHPKGNLLVDAGFGRDIDEHVQTMPWLGRKLTEYTKGRPAGEQLAAAGMPPASSLKGVLLTHAHYDHVSGLDDLAGVPVWVNGAELAFIRGESPNAALIRSFDSLTYHEYRFDDGPYLGFPQSFDVWGDGAVVVVPAPGHTPGSVVVFVALPSGQRYALLGDLVWQREGITLPAERPWLPRWLIGEDAAQVRESIARIAAIHQRYPEIELVPAHDVRALAKLPRFTAETGSGARAVDEFLARLAPLCGQAFAGRIVADRPAASTPDPFAGKALVMHVRECGDAQWRIPFHVGADRSRTWVLTRTADSLRLKHDHRHEDGTPDAMTMYGGDSAAGGTSTRQQFPVDAESIAMFEREGRSASVTNVWAMEIEPGARFVYELSRPDGRLFRVEFDLAQPVAAPPPPWGASNRSRAEG